MSIKSLSTSAVDASNSISSRNMSYSDKSLITLCDWKGEIGSADKDFNKQISNNINMTLRKYMELGRKLNGLDLSIDKAERAKVVKQQIVMCGR